MVDMVEQEQAIHKKSLKLEASTNGVSIQTSSSDNDLLMVGLLGMIILTGLAMWIKYKVGSK